MKMNKKGALQELGALGIGIASLTITLVVVFLILSNVGTNSTVAANSNATAAVNTLTQAAGTIPGWVPLIVIVFIGAIILGLIRFFRQ